ncbi:MAG: GAF domain-containing protein [Chloroflexota bacterium]
MPITQSEVAEKQTSMRDAALNETANPNTNILLSLNKMVRDQLRIVALGAGIVYACLAIAHYFLLMDMAARIMVPLATGTAVFFFTLRSVLRYWKPPPSWAHPIAASMIGLMLLNSQLHIYLTNEPQQTTNVLLIVMGTGLFLLSSRWFVAVQIAALASWLLIVDLQANSDLWVHFGLALLMGLIISAITFRIRQNSLTRFIRLRMQDAAQKAELQYRARQLETSMALGKRITSILNLDDLLDEVVELIREQYGYRFAAIFLLDDLGKYLTIRAGTGRTGRLLCLEGFGLEANEETLIGAAAMNGRSLWLNDRLQQPERLLNVMPDVQAELALPLQVTGVGLGVLTLQSQQEDAFNGEDIPFLELLADQVAIAIYNAYLYLGEQSTRLMTEKMYMTGRALSATLDWSELLSRVLENLSHVVTSDRVSIFLQRDGVLAFAAGHGFPENANPERIEIPINQTADQSIYGSIYHHKRPLAIPDVLNHPDWRHVDSLTPTRAWLGVPLVQSNQVVGILSLARETLTSYSEEEIRLATAFAEQAATALHNSNLYSELDQFNQKLEKQVAKRTEDLRQAYDQLEKLDRTKSDFISVAAHELRTPLTLLRGYSQMLLRDKLIASNDFHRELVLNIQAGESRLEKVVNAMIDMAKIDDRSLNLYHEPVSLPDILHEVVHGLRHSLKQRQQKLHLADISHLPRVEADPDALKKVFSHVITNAIKYTPDGGEIAVSGKPYPSANGASKPLSAVELVIQDSGIGIDEAYHELIFTKFYQTGEAAFHSTGYTKFKGGGPGLGLPIARGIVEAHRGEIWVESAGHNEQTFPGSEFHIKLPLKQPRES